MPYIQLDTDRVIRQVVQISFRKQMLDYLKPPTPAPRRHGERSREEGYDPGGAAWTFLKKIVKLTVTFGGFLKYYPYTNFSSNAKKLPVRCVA